jgi:hypothetical protein
MHPLLKKKLNPVFDEPSVIPFRKTLTAKKSATT